MTVNAVMGTAQAGNFATSRRGSLDEYERAFIAQKVAAGLSDFTIAQMLQRPRELVSWYRETLSLQRGERAEYQSGHRRKAANSNRAKPINTFPTRARAILVEVAKKHGVSVEAMTTGGRRVAVVQARQEAWSRIYDLGTYSLPQIGALFGRDHTTILDGIRRYEERTGAK